MINMKEISVSVRNL